MQNWWKDRKIIRQVADWAYELQKDHPRNRILSLGQSPAWVVQSVGMLRKLRGLPVFRLPGRLSSAAKIPKQAR